MKIFTKHLLVIFILSSGLVSHAQWSPMAIDSNDITLLKQVNGILFTYSYDINNPGGYLYQSTDQGNTWTIMDTTLFQYNRIYDMTYDSTHNLFEAIGNGIYYSADGLHWVHSPTPWFGDGITYIDSALVIASTDGGVAISTDSGIAFTPSNTGLFGPFYEHYVTRFNDTLYVSQQGTDVVMISTNGGANWVNYSDTLNFFVNTYFEHQGTVYGGLYFNGLVYHANNEWNYDTTGLPPSNNIWSFADAGDTLFTGGDSIGVWMNYNGTWTDFSCGLPPQTNVTKLARVGDVLFVGTDNGLWSYNLGTSCSAAGIASVSAAPDIEVYPTLTTGPVNILSPTVPQSVTLMDMQGRTLNSWHHTITPDLSRYASGMYLLNIQLSDNYSTVRRVIRAQE